jgi:hypothetical protein
MQAMLKALVTAVFLSTIALPVEAQVLWVTQDFQGGECVDVASGDVDKGEDYIIRQCLSFPGVSTWIHYQEGTRLYVGFGSKPNTAFSGADPSRGDWPLIWGGEKRGGKFVPTVVIGRFAVSGEEPSTKRLLVFRLLANGMSCVVAEVDPSPTQSDKAKSVATAAMKKWKCIYESQPLTY